MSSYKKRFPGSVKRLRIFAGPNGSGKSTIIDKIRTTTINGHEVDFGYYINADNIARLLREGAFIVESGAIELQKEAIEVFASSSGLLNADFTLEQLASSFVVANSRIQLLKEGADERLAQVIARLLREKMLERGQKFSFETVFSHESNLDIMRRAVLAGYKVYLYYVSTESPEINKQRVLARTAKGGHNVPEDKIESRYVKSLELLFQACQFCHQAYFFDNSFDGVDSRTVAHFKVVDGMKKWNEFRADELPNWLIKYYFAKALV